MKKFGKTLTIAALALGMLSLVPEALAQRAPRGQGANRPQRRFDPAQMRQRMMDRLRQQLNASEQEWQVIQPLLQNVMEKQRAARFGGIAMMFGRRPGSRGGAQVPAEIRELRDALENPNTPADTLKAKLDAYRKLRQKQDQELKAARDKLRQVLTLRQEAQLVMMGILD
ncbi:MAG: hypothetical protein J7M29_10125 [Verrucomicrobia bacterium]|nr:hypothetical protein [Verrucomicrobiota bacterium]